MSYKEVLAGSSIAVSISESPDMPALGLSEGHLRDAITEVVRHLMALGARLVYGGDLRQHGFTKLLFELVARHPRDTDNGDNRAAITNYLAWPVHIQKMISDLDAEVADLEGLAEIVCLRLNGKQLSFDERRGQKQQQPSMHEWSTGLTAMREKMLVESNGRIALGGNVDKFKGAMPGMAEEALLSMQNGQAIFLVGGFGGATRDIAETVGLIRPWAGSRGTWPGRDEFRQFSTRDLNNGLTLEENMTLAQTPHIDQAVMLILRGLTRVVARK